jgi:hypothetical protein
MKKLLLSLTLLASGCAAVAHAQVPINASTGTFSGAVSAANYGNVNGNWSAFTAFPGSVSGTNAGYTGWGKNGTGDMDFVAAANGSSPSFCWYFLLGSALTQEMCLNQNANLLIPNGSITATAVVSTSSVNPHSYTVAQLPGASVVGLGGMVIVTDANGTSTCGTGGGTTLAIAVSNGTSWTCH